MKGEWVHDNQRDTWHLIDHQHIDKEDVVIVTYCHLELPWDAATKEGADIMWADIVHDECLRESER